MTRLVLSLALGLSLALPTMARSDAPPAPAMGDVAPARPRVSEEVTVTAKPILEGIRVDSLAGTIATVGRTQIEDLNAQDVASALRRVPGMSISPVPAGLPDAGGLPHGRPRPGILS